MDFAAFAFICLVWGSTFIATERASHALGPVGIGVWRLLGGTLVLAVLWAINHRSFAALHFTGSTFIFRKLWKDIATAEKIELAE